MPERATVLNRSEKSAEAVVVANTERRAEREGVDDDVTLDRIRHQKPGRPGRAQGSAGEARAAEACDEVRSVRNEPQSTGRDSLLERALARENLAKAWKRVKANKGSAGVDGRTMSETADYLKTDWPRIREELRSGSYRPLPVRRAQIPKTGGGQRELGIPTILDRLIQQALLQVLQPLLDPTFSDHSHGFRPGRRAQDAVCEAQHHVQSGYRVVVDVDLERFFDRVNHDVLMDRLAKRIDDKAILRLIRRYLNAGILSNGVVIERHEGTPQGGPLSPLLANVLLDEVDRTLEHRGHRFVRYADDLNVYVRSHKAGDRVLGGLRKQLSRLHLQVNEGKTAVTSALGRKFLGFVLWAAPAGEVKRGVADKAKAIFKQRIRWMTRRNRGKSLAQIIEQLRGYVSGWKAYFRFAQTPRVFRDLDAWLRRRLRTIHLKHWKRGTTIYRELLARGAQPHHAQRVAANSRRWWHNSRYELNRLLPIKYFDGLGLPRLS